MNCVVCGSNGWLNNSVMTQPDKYEKWVGITDVKRCWRKCLGCKLWHQRRNYPLKDLEVIYRNGYRHPDFRGETIKQAFERIIDIKDSENDTRVKWLTSSIDIPEAMLDIGSGIGVFPYRMTEYGCHVWCVEENEYSLEFINSLGIKCIRGIPYYSKFGLVSLVHVLEHIEDPIGFLKDVSTLLLQDGKLFIEVPDAIEFDILPPYRDDFNSCHTHFYEIPTLFKVLNRAGYNVIDMHREYYPERKLYRIMAIADVKKW